MEHSLTLFTFGVLVLGTFIYPQSRHTFFARGSREWIVDTTSLMFQGIVIPFLKILLMSLVWPLLLPGLAGVVSSPFWLAFLLNFTVVDYLYYWNHRLLHHPRLWRWHSVHHSSEQLDFAVTSRNSLMSHFFILYLWILSFIGFVLVDPTGLWWGAAASAALDLWRHSGWTTPAWVRTIAGAWLILPEDHEWHHGRDTFGVNYGANLKIWDHLHGTARTSDERCPQLGNPVGGGWREWLLAPREY